MKRAPNLIAGVITCIVISATVLACVPAATASNEPVSYVLRFPQPEHHWMIVEVTFPDVGTEPLQARMSRSSPGRYALHEFAKNIFDVHATDGSGQALSMTRPNPYQWDISGHDGTVKVTYKLFGDRTGGTYLGIDTTHAHMNMPATLMWARGLDRRPVRVRLVPPEEADWRVATQLFVTDDPLTFTAPNLQYLMDSPTEFGETSLREFTVDGDGPRFRVATHHQGSEKEIDQFTEGVQKIVEEERAVYGEYPAYDTGTYTFIADYLPYASGDGMEHRNSTILTSSGSLDSPQGRRALLGTVAHEFFHCWNVERIRPRGIEPFDFERANMSSGLWLAEGFTSYYGNLIMHRAGLAELPRTLASLNGMISTVTNSPGRHLRSAVDMSRLSPFVDAARSVDPVYWTNTFISYYTWGAAIGLGLDLTLRQRSDDEITLDDFMRAMWQRFGKPGGPSPAIISNPYSVADARQVLADVSGDADFATDFFNRYIEGHEIVDYKSLLQQAGLVLRKAAAGRPWLGGVRLNFSAGTARVVSPAPFDSPTYLAGIDEGDVLASIDGKKVTSAAELARLLDGHSPGDTLPVRLLRRGGEAETTLTLAEDPRAEIVPLEETGGTPSETQLAFRKAWLGSQRAEGGN
ncbi:MAG: M61 family metallopeptidase [Acidobacteriota bacterium]